jgi:CPA2 family monovalent cation:H+ antiporter-2
MHILIDITIVLGISAVALYFCLKLKIPSIVAFLLAGMIAGPHGFGLVSDVENVEMLAEVGVLLLLFTIGIEFSLEKLISSKRYIFLGGSLQMIFTIIAFTFLSRYLGGMEWNKALFTGFLFSLSSTAIVLQLFQETNQIESYHGRASLSILIFQDIAIVPLILILPWIAGGQFAGADIIRLSAGVVLVALILIVSRKYMPRLIEHIVHTRNRELFLLFIITVCFLTALLTHQIGLSLALGAFLAGLIISESEYSLEAISSILPLKKVFTSIFFISIGMLLNGLDVFSNPIEVLGLVILVLAVKISVVVLAGWMLRMPRRALWISALALCQVGEFAFILSQQGAKHNLMDSHISQMFLAVSVITMGISPFIIHASPRIANFILRFTRGTKKISITKTQAEKHQVKLKDHLLIVGFGINGRNVARAAQRAGIPHVIIDYNPETYRKETKHREYFIYGDGSNAEILERASARHARLAVVATHDPIATEMIVSAIRKQCRQTKIIVRTRFLHETEVLMKLGADEVIPEEFETSIEIFTRVMKHYLVPEDEINSFIEEIRSENYRMFRTMLTSRHQLDHPFISQLEVIKLHVKTGSQWINNSLKDINLRKNFGINVIAVEQGDRVVYNPPADYVIQSADVLIALGRPEDFEKVNAFTDFAG